MAEAPYELAIGPAEVYVAPVGTAFPAINATPAGAWILVGALGDDNYTEDGVVVRTNREVTEVRTLGSTTIRKVAVTEFDFEVEFSVMDINPDMMQLAFGGDESNITVTAAGSGIAGNEMFAMRTDPVPIHRALLVRFNQSAFGNGMNTQFEVYSAVQTGSGEGTFSKSDPFAQTHVWKAIGTASGFVNTRVQTAAPL